jgi:transposase
MVRAAFPEGAKAPIQYDKSIKAVSTFFSVFQLIPCERLHEIFRDVYGISLSTGSICEYRVEAAQRLLDYGFVELVKKEIIGADAIYADETGINVLGKQYWYHICVSEKAVLGKVLKSRSADAIESMGILPYTQAVITHDHYTAYDRFDQTCHSLCNAHLLRELTGLEEKCGLKWPVVMSDFLLALKQEVDDAGGRLGEARQLEARDGFLAILQKAEEECPPEERPPWQKRGRAAKSKGRNLVERLRKDIDDVLRFMTSEAVSFTNNAAERALRMQKVHLKISGRFRNLTSANQFVLIRCYLMTCEKNGIGALDALNILFSGKLPPLFQQESSETQTPPVTAHLSNPLVSQAA